MAPPSPGWRASACRLVKTIFNGSLPSATSRRKYELVRYQRRLTLTYGSSSGNGGSVRSSSAWFLTRRVEARTRYPSLRSLIVARTRAPVSRSRSALILQRMS